MTEHSKRTRKMLSQRWRCHSMILLFGILMTSCPPGYAANTATPRPADDASVTTPAGGRVVGRFMQCTEAEAQPVCASNGTDVMLFRNACKLQDTNNALLDGGGGKGVPPGRPFDKVAIGFCRSHCKLVCPTAYEPVCAMDKQRKQKRRTFGNQCEMARDGCLTNTTWIKHSTGPCTPERLQSTKVAQRKVHAQQARRKKSRKSKSLTCTMIYNPVCAALFGVKSTFINECLVHAENARTGKEWKIYAQGICAEDNLREATKNDGNAAAREKQQDSAMGYSPTAPSAPIRGVEPNVLFIDAPSYFQTQFMKLGQDSFENLSNFGTLPTSAVALPGERKGAYTSERARGKGGNTDTPIPMPPTRIIHNSFVPLPRVDNVLTEGNETTKSSNVALSSQHSLKPLPNEVSHMHPEVIQPQSQSVGPKPQQIIGDSKTVANQPQHQLEDWMQIYSGYDGTLPEDAMESDSNRVPQMQDYGELQYSKQQEYNYQSEPTAVESSPKSTAKNPTKPTKSLEQTDTKKPLYYIVRSPSVNPRDEASKPATAEIQTSHHEQPALAQPAIQSNKPHSDRVSTDSNLDQDSAATASHPVRATSFPTYPLSVAAHRMPYNDPDFHKFPRLTTGPGRTTNAQTISNFFDISKQQTLVPHPNQWLNAAEGRAAGCKQGHMPICAIYWSNTRTFENICQLLEWNALRRQAWLPLHEGPCPLDCNAIECGQQYDPICVAWSGLKYTMFNDCHYRVAKCQDHNGDLEIISKGECKMEHSRIIEQDDEESSSTIAPTTPKPPSATTRVSKRKRTKKGRTSSGRTTRKPKGKSPTQSSQRSSDSPPKTIMKIAPEPPKSQETNHMFALTNWKKANAAAAKDDSSSAETAVLNSSTAAPQSSTALSWGTAESPLRPIFPSTSYPPKVQEITVATRSSTTEVAPSSNSERFSIYGPDLGSRIMTLIRTKVLGHFSAESTSNERTT